MLRLLVWLGVRCRRMQALCQPSAAASFAALCLLVITSLTLPMSLWLTLCCCAWWCWCDRWALMGRAETLTGHRQLTVQHATASAHGPSFAA